MLLKHASVQVISCLEGDQQIITNEFGIAESPNLNLVGWSESSSGFFTFPWQHQMVQRTLGLHRSKAAVWQVPCILIPRLNQTPKS